MAGIIAALTDNGQGIAGVGYAGVKVMPVTVLGSDGTGPDSDIIEGVVYAVDHGADVINMSFSNPGFSTALQAAIDYAWAHNVVVVAATGNDGSTTATFPAGDRGVIGVSNTDQTDALNASSNYGADTFLAAPGHRHRYSRRRGRHHDGDGHFGLLGRGVRCRRAPARRRIRLPRMASSSARLARNADSAGTSAETGNGRLNLARAIADTSTDSLQPSGAAPVGAGGPLVGPYTSAAKNFTITFAETGSGTVSFTNFAPLPNAAACTTTCTRSVDNNQAGTLTATPSAGSTFAGWSASSFGGGTTTCSSATNPCNFAMSNTNSSVTATFNLVPNPLPTTTSIAPTSRVAGDGAFTLTVNGTNFVASSVVRWAGADRVTTFVSSTQLTAAIPATDLTTTGPKAITVFNAAPGGGTSNAQTFTVNANPVPTTTSISPNTTDVGSGAFTLTVDGTNFVGNSVVRVNGAARTTIFVSSTELTAVIPASDTATTGAKTITVFNAAPVGGASNPQTLAVIPCSTIICIDGNIADWTAIPATPSYADNTTDAGGGSGDITAIRITSGNGNLYVRWDETLTSNKNMIASDGFSITVDANRDGTSDARGWVTFDSSGVPTVQVERPFGTFVTVGSAQQSCNFSACSNGGAASLEASFPLSAFAATGSIIGLQTETRASASTNSSTKDCVPGPIACNGFFNLDTDTGTTTVTAGHVTTTTLNCPDPVRNLSQATGTCTVTVHDTGVDTNSVVVPVAHPTGTVNFSVSNGTGTFTPIACTLSAAAAAADSTCTVTYTPTTGTANHTLKATYAGDTAPIQFASSSGTDSLAINSAPTDISLTPSSVAENQPSGTTVGTLSTTDPTPATRSPTHSWAALAALTTLPSRFRVTRL